MRHRGIRKLVNVIGAALMALFAAGGFDGAARAQDAPPGDAVEGKRLYLAVGCFLCHGRSGQGGAMNGPAPILAKTKLPFDAFKGQLRNPANDMPPYPDTLVSDQQVADIFAYLQSLSGPRPVSDVPILNN